MRGIGWKVDEVSARPSDAIGGEEALSTLMDIVAEQLEN
jgi:hypothetical protein